MRFYGAYGLCGGCVASVMNSGIHDSITNEVSNAFRFLRLYQSTWLTLRWNKTAGREELVYFTSRKRSTMPRLRLTRQPPLRGGRHSPPQSRFSISNFRVLLASLVLCDRPFFRGERRFSKNGINQSLFSDKILRTTFCGQHFAGKLRTRNSCIFLQL